MDYQKIIEHKFYVEDLEYICEFLNNHTEELKGKCFVITGASGLIGSCIVDALLYWNRNYLKESERVTVVAIGRNAKRLKERFSYVLTEKDFVSLKIVEQDLGIDFDLTEILNLVLKREADYIIHGASNSDPKNFSLHPVGTITTNIAGMTRILEYAKQRNTRVLYVSSREVYGFIPEKTAYEEEDYGLVDFNGLRSCYPESKRVSELLCRGYAEEFGVSTAMARLGYVYGPTMLMSDSKAIAQFMKKAVAGENIVMKSKGEQVRSYCYVADIVDGLFRILLDERKGEVFNAANRNAEISIRDLAEKIAGCAGVQVVFELPDDVEAKGYSSPQDAIIDEEKLRKIGYAPRYGIEEGVQRTFEILKALWNH
ncbi:MAG: NAD-dependent epimerase/dehydratase family protein [Lachnospiraceae bacterium]|nr:NAD-dependent epimerase/dehydratase family protein [Lachnospiraceae bacterium]